MTGFTNSKSSNGVVGLRPGPVVPSRLTDKSHAITSARYTNNRPRLRGDSVPLVQSPENVFKNVQQMPMYTQLAMAHQTENVHYQRLETHLKKKKSNLHSGEFFQTTSRQFGIVSPPLLVLTKVHRIESHRCKCKLPSAEKIVLLSLGRFGEAAPVHIVHL